MITPQTYLGSNTFLPHQIHNLPIRLRTDSVWWVSNKTSQISKKFKNISHNYNKKLPYNTYVKATQPLNKNIFNFKDCADISNLLKDYTHNDTPVTFIKTGIPVFQMKPGYSTLWRDFRREFKIISSLPFFRQRRLTNYFINFRHLAGIHVLFNLEFSLFSVLRSSKVFWSDTNIIYILTKVGVWINCQRVFKPFLQLYVGDCIQFCINSWLFQQYVRDFAWITKKRALFLTKILKLFGRDSRVNQPLTLNVQNHLTTKWLTNFSFLCFDIPNYLEVDYATMSIFFIYCPIFHCEFNALISAQVPIHAMRMYNWKYLN